MYEMSLKPFCVSKISQNELGRLSLMSRQHASGYRDPIQFYKLQMPPNDQVVLPGIWVLAE